MAIKCVTFDLDDTLWSIWPVIERAERVFHQWMSEHLPRVADSYSVDDLKAHRHAFFLDNPDLHHDLTRMRKLWMSGLARDHDYPEHLVDTGFHVFWKERNSVDLFDHVHDVLPHVSSRYLSGAITNGNADIHHIGIGEYFHFYLKSADVGKAKPHPDIFQSALDHAKCKPAQMVHVGDDPITDIRGAAELGIRTVWVNILDREWQGDHAPDAQISSLSELPAVLDGLEEE